MDKILKRMLHIAPNRSFQSYIYLKSIIFPFHQINHFVPCGEIIEVGCSYGLTAVYLALKSKSRKVMGLDNNSKRTASARKIWKSIPNISFRVSNLLDNIKIKKNQTILAVDLLHHLTSKEQKKFMLDCFEKFDETNTLIIKEINRRPLAKFALNYLGDLIMNPGEYNFKSFKVLKKEFERRGFDVGYREIKHPLCPHYILICRKR